MPTATDLSRLSKRRDQILEAQFDRFPDAPPQLMRLPGFHEFYESMRLMRERDIQTFKAIVNNLGIATSTPE
jgi:hypothetical protein